MGISSGPSLEEQLGTTAYASGRVASNIWPRAFFGGFLKVWFETVPPFLKQHNFVGEILDGTLFVCFFSLGFKSTFKYYSFNQLQLV